MRTVRPTTDEVYTGVDRILRIEIREANLYGLGKARSVNDLARREGIDGRSVRRLIPLGFLSPRIIEAIAEGRSRWS